MSVIAHFCPNRGYGKAVTHPRQQPLQTCSGRHPQNKTKLKPSTLVLNLESLRISNCKLILQKVTL